MNYYLWSIMRTLTPFFASALHAMTPAGPAPMMSTSTWHSGIDGVGDDRDILWTLPKNQDEKDIMRSGFT